MNGGPSQVDTWDYKPELEKHDGQELEGFDKNTGFFTGNVGPIMKSPFQFSNTVKAVLGSPEIFQTSPDMSTRWHFCTRAIPSPTTTVPLCL